MNLSAAQAATTVWMASLVKAVCPASRAGGISVQVALGPRPQGQQGGSDYRFPQAAAAKFDFLQHWILSRRTIHPE